MLCFWLSAVPSVEGRALRCSWERAAVMANAGSMLDRALGALEVSGVPMTASRIGAVLGLNASERNTLCTSLRRAIQGKLITRVAYCSRCGHEMTGRSTAYEYQLAADYEQVLKESERKRRAACLKNVMRSHAVNDRKELR